MKVKGTTSSQIPFKKKVCILISHTIFHSQVSVDISFSYLKKTFGIVNRAVKVAPPQGICIDILQKKLLSKKFKEKPPTTLNKRPNG